MLDILEFVLWLYTRKGGELLTAFQDVTFDISTRQESYWVINAKPTYCRSLQALG